MKHLLFGSLILSAPCLSAGMVLAETVTYQLPDETAEFKAAPGAEAAQNNCAACHSADYINFQPPHMGKTFWQGEVTKMIHVYHAPIDDDDAKAIVDYLASTY